MADVHVKSGWPLTPSKRWPGELALTCPRCNSQNITLSVRYALVGTGPGGRGRLGDAGSVETQKCNNCGNHWEGK